MWDFLKRSHTTPQQSALETAFLQQSTALVELAKGQQATIRDQQATLDRIVTARYDRPIERVAPRANEQMPIWGLTDQGEVRESDPLVKMVNAIGVESDEEFLKAAQ